MSSKKVEMFTSRGGKQYSNDDLVGVDEAIRLMGYAGKGSGAFGTACKTHPYLGAAIVDRVGVYIRRVALEAVERYVAEVKTGGSKSRDGLKWFSLRLTTEEARLLEAELSTRFNRDVDIEQPTVRTAAAQAARAAASVNDQHDENDNDSYLAEALAEAENLAE